MNTYTNKELGITGEVGPMEYVIPAVQLLLPKLKKLPII